MWSHCCCQSDMMSRHLSMSNQHWNNVVYVNVEIYNIEHCQINIVYFKCDINKVRQHPNNAVIFNAEFHNVDQCQNYAVNLTIFKKSKRAKNLFLSFKKKKVTHLINNTSFHDQLNTKGNMERTMQPSKLALALGNCQGFCRRKSIFSLICVGKLLLRRNGLNNMLIFE